MSPDLPELMTLADVIDRLRGKIARTALLAHLQAVPIFAGGPTHGRHGRRYLFTPAQYGRLVESLACPPAPDAYLPKPRPMPGASSELAIGRRLAKLLAPPRKPPSNRQGRSALRSAAPQPPRVAE